MEFLKSMNLFVSFSIATIQNRTIDINVAFEWFVSIKPGTNHMEQEYGTPFGKYTEGTHEKKNDPKISSFFFVHVVEHLQGLGIFA